MGLGPDRLKRFRVALTPAPFEPPWGSRAPLLEQVGKLEGGDRVVAAFDAVGTTRPVELDHAGKQLLLEVVEFWLRSGVEHLPHGIFDLRNVLLDDRAHGDLDA